MTLILPTRRDLLATAGGGFGAVALAHLLTREGLADAPLPNPSWPLGGLHHPAKVRRVIQLFMNGGASPMDTFDFKPALEKHHGEALGPKEKPEGFTTPAGTVMKSPFPFARHGQTGRWVSTVFPHQAARVDRMAFLMAMKTTTNVHGPASYMMNTGFMLPGFPCLGAWVSYGLGRIVDDLPEFVVLPDPRGLPYNQKGNFSAGFLPAVHQGTVVDLGRSEPIPDVFAAEAYSFAQGDADRDALALIQRVNRRHAASRPHDTRLEARIAAGELAARMQLSAPTTFDLAGETPATRAAYGLNRKETADFGTRCLIARRLIERGTRFVQVWSGPQGAVDNWDNHGSIPNELPPIALSVDEPIGGLLDDLGQRGLLHDTLVIWTTEFGRTPFAQNNQGRDHNGGTFVTWLAGAGVKAGATYGQSDDLGYQTAAGTTTVHDLQATILHLLGIDHARLTFRTAGVDRRLTDVHGHVVRDVLA
ncbi:MAG: DUF1501 domain-containing protein [Planctomycetota bacterium]|nr:MAG: DUF1501 domain-containing protein [Planctomycetota bacterium]